MTAKISITLDDEIVNFIDSQGSNRSKTINGLLTKVKQEQLKAVVLQQIETRKR